MAEDKSKRDFRGRDRMSAHEDNEVEYFAAQNGLTPDQLGRDPRQGSRPPDGGCKTLRLS
ncbi:DUF3606 domain-containing protein [Mesorhizobium sp. M0166]|uniref:hypothetical protein n=1 Tax=Mesorhizobium sp. M0166 TaxID=2956902 RepID=UPI0033370D33